jgi:hypothetical protein
MRSLTGDFMKYLILLLALNACVSKPKCDQAALDAENAASNNYEITCEELEEL